MNESLSPRMPSSPPAASSDPPESSVRRSAWTQACGHSLAAAALIDDPSVPSWTVQGHLQQGWTALAVSAGADPQDPISAIEQGQVGGLDHPAPIAAPLRALEAGAALEPTTIRTVALALSAAVRHAEDTQWAPEHRGARRRLWLRRMAMTIVVLIPVVVALVLTIPDHREGPWYGQYFDSNAFKGEPIIRRDSDLRFDWKRKGPLSQLPTDRFSVRWDTCMDLPEDLEITFQLVSDDGSRLYLDGQKELDNWGRHGERSRGATVPLTAGIHHLRVEYFDERHAASIELKASLRGELPESIPVRILRYPGEPFDENDPCASVRAQ